MQTTRLPDGTSALVLAAHSGHGDVAALLLDKGADPNAFATGYTALHAAVLRSDVTLVKALLAHGADPDMRMARGTPLRRDTTDFNLPAHADRIDSRTCWRRDFSSPRSCASSRPLARTGRSRCRTARRR